MRYTARDHASIYVIVFVAGHNFQHGKKKDNDAPESKAKAPNRDKASTSTKKKTPTGKEGKTHNKSNEIAQDDPLWGATYPDVFSIDDIDPFGHTDALHHEPYAGHRQLEQEPLLKYGPQHPPSGAVPVPQQLLDPRYPLPSYGSNVPDVPVAGPGQNRCEEPVDPAPDFGDRRWRVSQYDVRYGGSQRRKYKDDVSQSLFSPQVSNGDKDSLDEGDFDDDALYKRELMRFTGRKIPGSVSSLESFEGNL